MKARCISTTLVITLAAAGSAHAQRRSRLDFHSVSAGGDWIATLDKLNVRLRPAGEIMILDLSGTITKARGSYALRSAVERLSRQGHNDILLNLAGVNAIDSSGIGVMVSCFATVNRKNGRLKLLHLTKGVRDLLVITKLLTVFDVFDDESEALKSFDKTTKASPGSKPASSAATTATTGSAACATEAQLESELGKKLRQIIVDELGVEMGTLHSNTRFIEDLGADSLDAVELVMRLEEEFRLEIPDEDCEKLVRVGDVYCYIEKHTKNVQPK